MLVYFTDDDKNDIDNVDIFTSWQITAIKVKKVTANAC